MTADSQGAAQDLSRSAGQVAEDAGRILKSFDNIPVTEIIIIILASVVLTKGLEWAIPRLARQVPGRFRLMLLPLVPVLRLIIVVISVVLIIPRIIDPSLQNLVTILGAAGLALGFAFKDYVSSLIAGIVAIYERPYRPGDWVRVDDAYGEVRSLGMRSLQLVTPDDTLVTIPHMKIWDNNIYNANNGDQELMCVTPFYLEADHDAAAVRRVLREVALTSPYTDLDRQLVVILQERPWGTHYKLKAYPVDARDQFLFISDLTVRGKAALLALGVGFTRAVPDVSAEP